MTIGPGEAIVHNADSGQIAGSVYTTATPQMTNATLWSAPTASAVDLNPVGFASSNAFSVRNGQQVG